MKKYNTVIFDLDGTLIDTSEGIINCYNYTAQLFNKKTIEKERFNGIIGSPLLKGFMDNYDMTEEEVTQAVKKYRDRYQEVGMYEVKVYDHIPQLLKTLKQNGYNVAVATLKLEKFAKEMLEDNNIIEYFDVVYGPTESCEYKKVDLLNKALAKFGINKQQAVLVGDSVYDSIGAQEAGIDFIGVTYGLGFKTIDDIKKGYHTAFAENVEQIIDKIEQ